MSETTPQGHDPETPTLRYMAPHAWNYTMRLRGRDDALVEIRPNTAVEIQETSEGVRHRLVDLTEVAA